MHKETKKEMQNRVISKAWLLVKDAWFWGVCKSKRNRGGRRNRGTEAPGTGGGINHYWRTPPSVLHPDGPSTPDINHNSSTIDPLSSMLRKSLLLLLIFLFSLCLPYQHLHPPPSPSTVHHHLCQVIRKRNWYYIHKLYEDVTLYVPAPRPTFSMHEKQVWKKPRTNDIKITKRAMCYYTFIDLFLRCT